MISFYKKGGNSVENDGFKKLSRESILKCIFITLGIGIVSFLPILIRNNGQYMDYGDYFIQYVPFIKELKRMALSGNLSWSWNSFLGDSFLRAYSYYTIFNPFAWFVALFPDRYILYGTFLATLIKLVICSLNSMLYFGLFTKEDRYALIGSILYTFSGFTIVNTSFYFFLDVIAIFPLLMYGLELLIRYNKHIVYIMALAFNASLNIYFFVSTVFLVIVYVFFRLEMYKVCNWKKSIKFIINIFVSSLLGVGIVLFAIIPSFLAIVESGKATQSLGKNLVLFYWPQNILEHIRTFIAPIESGRYHAFYDGSIWSSTGMYLPVIGIVFVAQKSLKINDWLSKLSLVLVICYMFPVLNGIFNLFSNLYYTRWLYGIVLIFSLVSILEIERILSNEIEMNSKVLKAIIILTTIITIFPAITYLLYKQGISFINIFASVCSTDIFIGYKRMLIVVALTFANYCLLCILFKNKNILRKSILIIICIGSALNYFVYNAINYDVNSSQYSNEQYYNKTLNSYNNKMGFEYRIDYPRFIANYSLFKNMPSVNYYNSLQNSKSSNFAQNVGIGENIGDTILVTPKENGQYTDTLLSVKYYYDYDGSTKIPEGFKFYKTENNVDIYKNSNYIPMGFTYDSYCLEDDIKNLSTTDKSITLLNTMVISKNAEKEVSKYLPKFDIVNVDKNLTKLSSDRNKITCDSFNGDSSGFKASINLESANLVFFSIPNDKDWEIKVNGKAVDPIEVNYGLMAIECDKGTNKIIATYHNKGLKIGIIGSAIFVVICLIIFIFKKIRFN